MIKLAADIDNSAIDIDNSNALIKDLSKYNLDYNELNKKLINVKKEFGLKKAISSKSLTGETRTFAEILDSEVEKIVLFYLRQQGILANNAWELRIKQLSNLSLTYITIEKIDKLCEKYRLLGSDILLLLNYLENNLLLLRKIIEKHDELFDYKLSSYYFDTRLGKSNKNNQLLLLYHQEGIRAIISTLRNGFEDLYDAKDGLMNSLTTPLQRRSSVGGYSSSQGSLSLLNNNNNNNSFYSHRKDIPRVSYLYRIASFTMQQNTDPRVTNNSNNNIERKLSQRNKSTGNLFNILQKRNNSRNNLLNYSNNYNRSRSISDVEPILKDINITANRVMHTQKQSTIEYLASTSKVALEMSMQQPDMDITDSDKKKRLQTVHYGLHINLFLTFIYLANQYVVAPTSGEYASILGFTPAMSGIIIGLTPAAALVSSVLMSMWSNYSFKKPLLMCILCGIIGNILYGIALQCQSPTMLLTGRLLTGFGGPRVVTRRYIADHIPTEERFLASSKFVTAGAMGLAWGPLISSLVSRTNHSFDYRLYNNILLIRYNTMTAPGWIMALLWVAALIIVIIGFSEPDQKYMRANQIKEQKRSNSIKKMKLSTSTDKMSDDIKTTDIAKTSSKYTFNSIFNFLNNTPKDDKITELINIQDKNHKNYGSVPTEEIAWVETGNQLFAPLESVTEVDSSKHSSNTQTPLVQSRNTSGASLSSNAQIAISSKKHQKLVSPHSSSATVIMNNINDSNNKNNEITSIQSNNSINSIDDIQISTTDHNLVINTNNSNSSNDLNSSKPLSGNTGAFVSSTGSNFDILSAKSPINSEGKTPPPDPPMPPRPTLMRIQSMQPKHFQYIPDDDSGSFYVPLKDDEVEVEEETTTCLDYITTEVLLILLLYTINKVGQELSVSSIPLLTKEIFNWTEEESGYYMAVSGALVLPINILVNMFIKEADERDILLRLLYTCIISTLFVCHSYILGPYTLLQYVIGSASLFAALNSMEGIIMALLAKLISPELAKGTFNSGLLATEAGTFGRVIGDMSITLFGFADEPSMLVNKLYLPLSTIIIIGTILVHLFYDRLI